MEISLITADRAADIADLALQLIGEIIERTGTRHFDVDLPRTVALCRTFIADGRYRVLAASDGDRIIGFGALCESHSLYAEGSFGILQEFYVLPAYRGRGVGGELLDHIVAHGRQLGWKRIELCTPPLPAFARSLDFYRDNGFEITGGHKMKRLLG